jgi:hypothetical protein
MVSKSDDELMLILEGLVGAAGSLLRSPPLEYGGTSQRVTDDIEKHTAIATRALADATTTGRRVLDAFRELLACIPETVRERVGGRYHGATDEALTAATCRAWQLIDAYRRKEL